MIKLGEQRPPETLQEIKKDLNDNSYVEKAELTENGFINITLNIVEIIKYLQKSKEEILKTIKTDPKNIFLTMEDQI